MNRYRSISNSIIEHRIMFPVRNIKTNDVAAPADAVEQQPDVNTTSDGEAGWSSMPSSTPEGDQEQLAFTIDEQKSLLASISDLMNANGASLHPSKTPPFVNAMLKSAGCFDYLTAMGAMNAGNMVTRVAWLADSTLPYLFCFDRRPDTVEVRFVDNIRTLPRAVKDLIIATGMDLTFENSSAAVAVDGRIDPSPQLSAEDKMTPDWLIFPIQTYIARAKSSKAFPGRREMHSLFAEGSLVAEIIVAVASSPDPSNYFLSPQFTDPTAMADHVMSVLSSTTE